VSPPRQLVLSGRPRTSDDVGLVDPETGEEFLVSGLALDAVRRDPPPRKHPLSGPRFDSKRTGPNKRTLRRLPILGC